MFVNVHTTVSPASISSVAVRPEARRGVTARTRALQRGQIPTRLRRLGHRVRAQLRDASRSERVLRRQRRVAGVGVEIESAGTPGPVRSKSKSCGSDAGSVTLTNVRRACLVFSKVHTTVSPASMSSVAVDCRARSTSRRHRPCSRDRSATSRRRADSLTVWAPSWRRSG